MSTRYNERSWNIDVISEINLYCANKDRKIKRAGGELTIRAPENNLFPDVLLYGEAGVAEILQGWELKFPDTPITDGDLINNAIKKAKLLGLNSFLLWNVRTAVLYTSEDFQTYSPEKRWGDLSDVVLRSDVNLHRERWLALLHEILEFLNEFFEKGKIKEFKLLPTLTHSTIPTIVSDNVEPVAKKLQKQVARDQELDSEITVWWRSVRGEYLGNSDRFEILAQHNLVGWISKFVFCHILKRYYDVGNLVNGIDEDSTVGEAQKIFKEISERYDFWSIFGADLGGHIITAQAWLHIVQLNRFLADIRFEELDQSVLHGLLQETVYVSRRKLAGQYATPSILAELLARITIDDKTLDVIDPFCGTGTIAKAVYDLKIEYGQTQEQSLEQVWAGDKFTFPLRMTTLALSDPLNMGQLIQVFRKDIVDLRAKMKIDFQDPNTGDIVTKELPKFAQIVSNLPFVRSEDVAKTNPRVLEINRFLRSHLGRKFELHGKSDLYAYLVFYLWSLLADGGRAGLIVSNAWLGTQWGDPFQKVLERFFHIKKVIMSGNGRWFENAEVVTTVIILEKRPNISPPLGNEITSFITLEKLLPKVKARDVSSDIIQARNVANELMIVQYKKIEIKALQEVGIGLNALFSELRWLLEIKDKLIPSKEVFSFRRGERRGRNAMFYPKEGHGIESDYLKPVLKSPGSFRGLEVDTNAEAFCCSESIDQLKKLGHDGALAWIRKFQYETNNSGKPLPEALSRHNHHWYEMKRDKVAEFFALINYNERLYIGRAKQPAFMDQRLIAMSPKRSGANHQLYHALLNSALGLFYIEALGFGRGLGALDLNKTKIEDRLFMLNPDIIDVDQASRITEAFLPLLSRDVLPLDQELRSPDRVNFDKAVFSAFDIDAYRTQVIETLKRLYKIRRAALRN